MVPLSDAKEFGKIRISHRVRNSNLIDFLSFFFFLFRHPNFCCCCVHLFRTTRAFQIETEKVRALEQKNMELLQGMEHAQLLKSKKQQDATTMKEFVREIEHLQIRVKQLQKENIQSSNYIGKFLFGMFWVFSRKYFVKAFSKNYDQVCILSLAMYFFH